MVGIVSSSVTFSAAAAGTISSTTANAPASSTACASSSSCLTPSPRPWMTCPPSPCSLCGVKPMCAITGMPADTIRRICSALRTPPSSFTAWAPVSFMNRNAVCSASSGRSRMSRTACPPTTSARFTAPATARVSGMSMSTRDRQRRVVAEDVVAGGVADQQEVDAGLVEDARRELVVAGQPRDRDGLLLGPLEMPGPDSLEVRLVCRSLGIGHGASLRAAVVEDAEAGRAVGDRHPAIPTERHAAHLRSDRDLPALSLGAVDE